MSTSHKPASRLIASASLFALLTGCITAEAPSTQELAVIDKATVTLMPASAGKTLATSTPASKIGIGFLGVALVLPAGQ